MLKTIVSNLREIAFFAFMFPLLIGLLLLLGNAKVADSPAISTVVAILTNLVTATLYFNWVLFLAWFGTALTLPEANKFIQSKTFDKFWDLGSEHKQMAVAIITVGVLAIVAAICLAAAN